jgi:hypothetical protein
MRDQTTATEGPAVGRPGAQPEPQRTIITQNLKAELPKLNPEIAAKVRAVVSRKP